MRVLLIEDDQRLVDSLGSQLREAGYAVDVSTDGIEGLYVGAEFPIDLAIIDLGLPELPGLEVIRELRERGRDFPILVLTARADWQDKVAGLEAGADDYVTKPFVPKELGARIRAQLRRIATESGEQRQDVIACGPIVIRPGTAEAFKDGEPLALSRTEFRVLQELIQEGGRVLSRDDLLRRVWGYGNAGDGRVVDNLIYRLRAKLEVDAAKPDHLVTVRGFGYRLKP